MSGAFGRYSAAGPAAIGRALGAAWLDWGAGAALAMLVFPFPIVRQSLPAAAFAAAVVGAVLVGAWLYLALTASLLGRTPGMYLLDLGFRGGPPPLGRALLWGGAWALLAVPALALRVLAAPERGIPDRVSGLVTCTVSANAPG